MKKQIQFYVYIYKDPKTGEVVYIGKGQKKRAWAHITTRKMTRLSYMLNKRIRKGYDPQPIIYNCENEQHALDMEIFWIDFYGREDLGKGSLFNLTNGGEGSIAPSQLTKDKISKTNKEKGIRPTQPYVGPSPNKGKIASVELREKMSQANLAKPNSIAKRARDKQIQIEKEKKIINSRIYCCRIIDKKVMTVGHFNKWIRENNNPTEYQMKFVTSRDEQDLRISMLSTKEEMSVAHFIRKCKEIDKKTAEAVILSFPIFP